MVERSEILEKPPGDSSEQREAEVLMVRALADQLGVALAPRRIELPGGVHMELDAASDDLKVLVEAWAHQGPAKPAQRNKVLTDGFKLAFVNRALGKDERRLILLFSDSEAPKKFTSGWAAAALREFGVELVVVDLDADVKERIWNAQQRQYR